MVMSLWPYFLGPLSSAICLNFRGAVRGRRESLEQEECFSLDLKTATEIHSAIIYK